VFITFDVCDFYPSIFEKLLTKAIDYASQFTHISSQDRHIITHTKNSVVSPEHVMGKEKHQVCVTEEDEDQLLTVPALMYRRFAYSASLRLKWVLQLKSLKIKK